VATGHVHGVPVTEAVRVAFAREPAAPLRSFPIKALEGQLRATVRAAAEPTIREERLANGTLAAAIEIALEGSDTMTCIARSERMDLGSMMLAMTKAATNHGAMAMPESDVTAAGERLVLQIYTPYFTQENGQSSLGLVKIAGSVRDDGTLVCLHLKAGGERAFRDVVTSLVSTATYTSSRPKARFRELNMVRFDGKPSGYEERQVYDTKTGGRLEVTFMAGLITAKEGFSLLDAVTTAELDAAGELEKESDVVALDGAVITRVSLRRQRKLSYAYEGLVDGKETKGEWKTKVPISCEISRASGLRTFASGTAKDFTFLSFSPPLDAAGPKETVVRRNGASLVFSSGDRSRSCTLDKVGLCKHVEERHGSVLVATDRMFEEGQL
jgi:hypothetical protein